MIDVNESPLPRQPSLVHLFNAGTIRLVVSIPPMLFSFVEHCEHRPSSLSPHLSLLFIKLLNPHTICLTRYVNMIMIISADSQVSLLYEGEQIFFGRTTDAKAYFVNMGFECPAQQTTPDFLTSLTSASERTPRSGFENKVPRSPQEFAQAWKSSPEYTQLQKDIDSFGEAYPFKGKQYEEFVESRKREKSKHSLVPFINTSRERLIISSIKSPYTLSFVGQTRLCLKRGFWRLKAEPTLTITQLGGNLIMSLVIGSVFYNLGMSTAIFKSELTIRRDHCKL